MLTALALGLPAISGAQDLQLANEQPVQIGGIASASENAKARFSPDVYIIQLADDAVPGYMGGTDGLAATSNRATGATDLDTKSPASVAYADYLLQKQEAFIEHCEAAFGHSIEVAHQYQHAINGLTMKLSPDEAKRIKNAPGVKSVSRERIEVPLTDAGPAWIGAPAVWGNGSSSKENSRGEGVVVAILDSGINSDHPSFADISGDGYDHTNPLGSGNYVPGSYCVTDNASFCNDKLIGAWDFDLRDGFNPEDDDGHGSHTAATTAGNVVYGATLYAPTTSVAVDISGVAPRANIIAYDVCAGRSCAGGALVQAINQVIIDNGNVPGGIQALNYSISGGGDPYNDTVELGFLNAVEAGVYVSASAGNSGPGASTVAHLGPWVSTTAASTHNRSTVNSLVGITSDGGSAADITGAGLTAGYGPATIINSADLEADFPGSTLCGLGEIGDLNPPWPPGTFNGEIVACTRGTFGRVEKGANVLAAGAGGYVLMDNGAGIVGDSHVLPGVHVTQADGAVLGAWITANAGNNPMATISGYSLDLDPANGDIMAGFSSRGPSDNNVIKPDITAPGVNVFAAEANGQATAPEYQIISGTSMSSPHNAGAGALVSAVRPDWTPQQIKSAIMMTSVRSGTVKEDGVTPTDPHDLGAGRIELSRAQHSGLVLDESKANFLAANPEIGGDTRTLNLASMQDDNCVGECSWTRTVTNPTNKSVEYDLSVETDGGVVFKTDPKKLKVKKGESKTITVYADTSLADGGWNYASLEMSTKGKKGKKSKKSKKGSKNSSPDLHMPIAIQATSSSNPTLLTKTVDAETAAKGEPLMYEINVTNGPIAGQIDLEDMLGKDLMLVPGSLSQTITNGTAISGPTESGGNVYSSFMLDPGGIQLTPGVAPFGYFSLGAFGIAPLLLTCNGDCDDGGYFFNVPAYTYNGETYTQTLFSINGTLEAGSASGVFSSFNNQNLPDQAGPNNIIAPFWRDLNLSAGGNMYIAVLNAGPYQFTVYEWEAVPHFGGTDTVTMQVWVGNNGTAAEGWISIAYGVMDNTTVGGTVGVENSDGTIGSSYFYNGVGTAPVADDELEFEQLFGGTATINFEAEIKKCHASKGSKGSKGSKKGKGSKSSAIVNRVNITADGVSETAIAVTECVK